MAKKQSQAAVTMLCEQLWDDDPMGFCRVQFHEDGTGLLRCRNEIVPYLSTAIKWKSLESSVVSNSSTTTGETAVARLELEISLSSDRLNQNDRGKPNDFWLKSAAFEPKHFKVTIEKGVFWHPSLRAHLDQKHLFFSKQCPLQLTFDTSPYPPAEEWNDHRTMGVYAHKFWERKQFCAGQIM